MAEIEEVWRPIPEWPYEASSLGRVRRSTKGVSTHPGKVLKANSGRHIGWYAKVRLSRGSRLEARTFHVHELVALAFIGPRPEGYHINHINGNKRDNRPDNLEYVTAAENVAHARANGMTPCIPRGVDVYAAKLTDAAVREIRATPRRHGVVTGLARKFGVDRNTIYRVLNGKGWTHV